MNEHSEISGGAHKSADKFCFAIIALIIVAQFVFMMKYFEPSISGMDSHGYYGQAKLLATTGRPYKTLASEIEFIGYTWNEGKNGRYYTMWPPGFPALVAVVYRIFGPVAGMYVNPIMAALTIMGVFLLCRLWVGSAWGAMAAALYATNPAANLFALMGYSHTASAFFLVWGVYFFGKWMNSRSAKWAVASGLALGFLPLIRTPEIVITAFITLFAMAGFRIKEDEDPNGLGLFLIGVVIPVLVMFTFNHLMFGSFMNSGYSILGYKFTNVFKIASFQRNCIPYLEKLLSESGGFSFVLGFFGFIYLLTNDKLRRFGILLVLITVPVNLVYMSYSVSPDSMAMRRFVVPTIPFFIIGAAWFIKLTTDKNRVAAIALSAALIFMSTAWGLSLSVKEMKTLKRKNAVLTKITEELKKIVEPGSVLIADEIVCQNLDYFNYWRLVDISTLNVKQGRIFGKRGGYEFFEIFEKDLRALSSGRKTYWLTRKYQSNNYLRYSRTKQDLKLVKTISIPRLSEFQEEVMPGGAPRRMPAERAPDIFQNKKMDNMIGRLANGSPLELYQWNLH